MPRRTTGRSRTSSTSSSTARHMSDADRRSELARTAGRDFLTPSQTVGPFLSIGLAWDEGPVADPDGVRLGGVVYDGAAEPIGDALVEVWSPAPAAFPRCATDD